MIDTMTLTEAEQSLFKDRNIEAAYQAWAVDYMEAHDRHQPSRKAFLARIRFLFEREGL